MNPYEDLPNLPTHDESRHCEHCAKITVQRVGIVEQRAETDKHIFERTDEYAHCTECSNTVMTRLKKTIIDK